MKEREEGGGERHSITRRASVDDGSWYRVQSSGSRVKAGGLVLTGCAGSASVGCSRDPQAVCLCACLRVSVWLCACVCVYVCVCVRPNSGWCLCSANAKSKF